MAKATSLPSKQTKKSEVVYVPLKSIVPDPAQPCKFFDAEQIAELMKSINEHGLMTPLTVEKLADGKYMLVDGERRFRSLTELKYDSVPVIPMETMSLEERRIKQFHIQQQHKSWTPMEMANAMRDLAEAMGVSIPAMGQILGISSRTVGHYVAFANLLEKDCYMKSEIPISMADGISAAKAAARHGLKKIEEKFEVEDERQLEKVIIQKIKDKEITNSQGIQNIVDSFRMEPKSIKKFIKGSQSISDMFRDTKAKGHVMMRRIGIESSYFIINAQKALEDAEVLKLLSADPRYRNKVIKAADIMNRLAKAIS
jgi:ParB/RepB/Spo0J family partition protein